MRKHSSYKPIKKPLSSLNFNFGGFCCYDTWTLLVSLVAKCNFCNPRLYPIFNNIFFFNSMSLLLFRAPRFTSGAAAPWRTWRARAARTPGPTPSPVKTPGCLWGNTTVSANTNSLNSNTRVTNQPLTSLNRATVPTTSHTKSNNSRATTLSITKLNSSKATTRASRSLKLWDSSQMAGARWDLKQWKVLE